MSKIVLQILKSNEDIPEVKEKNWKVTVIDQEDQNAFVLPNGHIFVFNGMLDMCSNDSQLGIVIGHEIAHALLNHTGEKLTYVNFISALLLIPMAVIWAFVPNDGIGKVFLHIRSLQNKFPTHYLKQSEGGQRLTERSTFKFFFSKVGCFISKILGLRQTKKGVGIMATANR